MIKPVCFKLVFFFCFFLYIPLVNHGLTHLLTLLKNIRKTVENINYKDFTYGIHVVFCRKKCCRQTVCGRLYLVREY
jgi:hypothetical protein